MRDDYAYAADDRSKEDPDRRGQAKDLTALRAIWNERDVHYVLEGIRLRPEQIEAVRTYRKTEVNDLPPGQRAQAWGEAASWTPPR